jgi:hypothetical protein
MWLKSFSDETEEYDISTWNSFWALYQGKLTPGKVKHSRLQCARTCTHTRAHPTYVCARTHTHTHTHTHNRCDYSGLVISLLCRLLPTYHTTNMHALSGLEPMVPAIKQLQIYTLDHMVTGIGTQQLSGRFRRQYKYKDITIINEDKSKVSACTHMLTHTHTQRRKKNRRITINLIKSQHYITKEKQCDCKVHVNPMIMVYIR